jgi:NadR type nicotinamide-nucleotide adenylyltransferase
MLKKIVIIGPESTGKSTLCEQLSKHYHCSWVKEYARDYLLKNGTDYTFENLLDVAKCQIEIEENAVRNININSSCTTIKNELLIIDTDMQVLKVWCEFVFNQCHHWILNTIAERKYDLYLLCNIDLPWVKDELREYPDLAVREKLYHHYKDILINQSVPWANISGLHQERLNTAISCIDKLFY